MSLRVEIDASDLHRYLGNAKDALGRVIVRVAEELADEVSREAASASTRLGRPWEIEGTGAERRVEAPEFFAHFLAHGTRAHGPRQAERMVFSVDGRLVSTSFVEGVRADPFDERAIDSVERRADDLIASILAGVR